jgi:hypothetical protein
MKDTETIEINFMFATAEQLRLDAPDHTLGTDALGLPHVYCNQEV